MVLLCLRNYLRYWWRENCVIPTKLNLLRLLQFWSVTCHTYFLWSALPHLVAIISNVLANLWRRISLLYKLLWVNKNLQMSILRSSPSTTIDKPHVLCLLKIFLSNVAAFGVTSRTFMSSCKHRGSFFVICSTQKYNQIDYNGYSHYSPQHKFPLCHFVPNR